MKPPRKSNKDIEFGDFQTPSTLAKHACQLLSSHGIRPKAIVEPSCGMGSFLFAALSEFTSVQYALGVDINPIYISVAHTKLQASKHESTTKLICADFFSLSWDKILEDLPDPIMIVGNPPWVTNSQLAVLNSNNLPAKSNFQKQTGLDALTGKSNFDISEWMILHLLKCLRHRKSDLGMLCKTSVARKVLTYAWKNDYHLGNAHIHTIDAGLHFSASVDACLLVCQTSSSHHFCDCACHPDLTITDFPMSIGFRDERLVSNTHLYDKWKHLQGQEIYKWRSGIKHDCSKVMELRKEGESYRNGFDELLNMGNTFLYPMLKSSDLNNGKNINNRWMIVPQTSTGEDTLSISSKEPNTWNYLIKHVQLFEKRASVIYKNRPPFSVFGIGAYTFKPWKIAISGFYKSLNFSVIGPASGKPVVFDDTIYFISCETQNEAEFMASLLNSDIAHQFFSAHVFWDAKRPITADLLRRLDIQKLSIELGKNEEFNEFYNRKLKAENSERSKCGTLSLF